MEPIKVSNIPTWIQNLLDHPHLLASFKEDMLNQKLLAEKEGLRWVEKSDMAKAQIALGKAKTFEALMFSVTSIIKERQAQDGYMEQRGIKTKSTKQSKR